MSAESFHPNQDGTNRGVLHTFATHDTASDIDFQTLIRQSDISERQRKRILEERELEIRHLEAERDSLAHQAHELQNQLLRRLAAANKKHDVLAAARSADIQRFDEERAALEAENVALKGAVATAVAQQHDHKQRCREDRKLTKKRLEQQATAFEVAGEANAQRLAAEELRTSSLKAENDLLTERLASADTAREAMIAAHQAQIEQYDHKLAEHEAQYATLHDSFQSTNVKRRLHIAHCEEENASARARNEDLAAQLAAKDTSYEELKANYDAVVHKNLDMSEAYKVMEAKLKAAERELYLERLAHRADTDYQVLPATKGAPGLVSESTLVNVSSSDFEMLEGELNSRVLCLALHEPEVLRPPFVVLEATLEVTGIRIRAGE